MTLKSQRLWKREQVKQLLARIGGFKVISENNSNDGDVLQGTMPGGDINSVYVPPVAGTDESYGYRSKVSCILLSAVIFV